MLYAAMQRYSFPTIVSAAGGLPLATLAPVVARRLLTDRWTVWSHMARANPQW
ncbi:MAG: FMN-binding negative transcriptional regulator, partial [Geodermatophilaceae bacterium]|nr:FMN-binding negative transcriptional regulator [Geodermatophilaceae bacterium]